MIGMPLLPLSSAPDDMPPPSAMTISTPRARDDGGLPPCFDGSCPPHGCGHNVSLPCPYCGKQNHPTNKCCKQFHKPPTTQAVLTPLTPFSPTLPNIPTPQYYVTLTLTEYDALRHFASIDVFSSSSLALLLAPSTSGTSALLASSSPLCIINSRASSHLTKTSLLLSSYHPTPLPSPCYHF